MRSAYPSIALFVTTALLWMAPPAAPRASAAPAPGAQATAVSAPAGQQPAGGAPGAVEAIDAPAVTGPWAPDVAEPGSEEAIRAFTTSPEYLPSTVAYVPDSDTVPSPAELLGHLVGAPDELSRVADVHGYFRALAAASDRVWVESLGTTEEGRELLLAVISDAANLADLDRLAEITRALADPRRTPRGEARSLAAAGKPFYYLLGGLHSPETGSPEMLMELAYRLAVSERPEIRSIRENTVVLITPVAEPDGRDRMVDWYYRHLKGRDLPWKELAEFASPPYWGHYAYHDNNRDGMQRTLALTRAVHEVFHRFHPQVVHDLHESLPLLYISTGHGPYSEAIDPVTLSEWTEVAHREAGALQAEGLPGVWTWGFWDGWWPGYLVSVANNHNSVGRFYETFGNASAGTFTRDLSEIKFVGKPVTEVQWYRPWPPGKEVEWSLRNNTNYMQAGVLEALRWASVNGSDLLWNAWVKAERSLARGREEAPHAWAFPPQQRDPARLAVLVNRLRAQQIEIHRLTADLTLGAGTDDEKNWPAGTFVVRLDQPYRNAAVNFLQRQEFPQEEPNRPYDDVAWTWPLLLGVEGEAVDDPAILAVPVAADEPAPPAEAAEPPRGRSARREIEEAAAEAAPPAPTLEPVLEDLRVTGSVGGFGDDIFVLADRGQSSLLAARVLLGDHQVDAAEEAFEAAGISYPAGSWIVYAPRPELERLAAELGLVFEGVLSVPDVRRHVVDLPRLGVVHTWTSTQDAGWARYTLDRQRMPYELVRPEDLRRGDLSRRFDVLLFPNTRGDLRRIVHGIDPKYGPLAYTRTAEFPSHGTPDASPDITGGMGFAGLLELQRFVEEGGVLVLLANAGTVAVDSGLVRGVDRVDGLHTPGSELAARVLRPAHPIAYGYEEKTGVFRGNGPVWKVDEEERSRVVVQFGDEAADGAENAAEAAVGGAGEAVIEEEELPGDEEPLVEEIETLEVGAVSAEVEEEAPGAVEAASPAALQEGEQVRDLVLSGFVEEKDKLAGQPAILDLPVGEGRVILFAFNPLHRYLNHSDFRFAWNVLLHWNDLPREGAAPAGAPFATAPEVPGEVPPDPVAPPAPAAPPAAER